MVTLVILVRISDLFRFIKKCSQKLLYVFLNYLNSSCLFVAVFSKSRSHSSVIDFVVITGVGQYQQQDMIAWEEKGSSWNCDGGKF